MFTVLQSRMHELWARTFSSSMKDDLCYTPTTSFNTFPRAVGAAVESGEIGRKYYQYRSTVMLARNEGMTKTYNRFHARREPAADIAQLRQLHAEMDRVVLRAYGWGDLAECAEPRFLDEEDEDDPKYQDRLFWPRDFRDEMLARLLALNAERAAGIAPLSLATEVDKVEFEEV